MKEKTPASLSLDLDNKWSYQKTHGDKGWESFPSYLETVVPRVLEFMRARAMTITFFIVGQDAALEKNHGVLHSIAAAGHEIGNHSFHHEPWLHLYSADEITNEITRAEDAIETATDKRPRGFRGPGYSLSPAVLDTLVRKNYLYDASTLPTYLGPLARAYYFMTTKLTPEERAERKKLFGGVRDGLRPLKPYRWRSGAGEILEIPVTTMPLLKAPIHISYLLYLANYAPPLALHYFRLGLQMCRLTGTQPSILLHPLDFLGADDKVGLDFFPAMRMPTQKKLQLVADALDLLQKHYRMVSMEQHALEINTQQSAKLKSVSTETVAVG